MSHFKVTFESTMKSEKTTYFTTHRNPCVSDPHSVPGCRTCYNRKKKFRLTLSYRNGRRKKAIEDNPN